jgi:hypothetical protein
MYIDETGNSDEKASADPNHRYLSLTGVILDLDYVDKTLFPALEGLKREYFGSHPDEPIVLHRKELVNKRPPFEALQDAGTEARWNDAILGLLESTEFVAITAVIDKLEHLQRYTVWRYDPYHYCLAVLVERYALWLGKHAAMGDTMAESRGGNEDRRLKDSFERLVAERGSDYMKPGDLLPRLTSRQLKVKPKANNIAGLQIADLIAHPSFRATLARRSNQSLADNFGGRIAALLEASKYDRNPRNGSVWGWGRKWLP